MKRVNVLMSTYNGERFLHQQIESILRQDEVDVVLTVRDDGSTDKTCAILDEYQSQGLLTWYSGDNLGPARSFMQLLKDADEADYYAFADQDDFWKPEKLKVAVHQLEAAPDQPALYFCQTCLTDQDLNPLPHQIPISPLLTYGESLVYQFVGGCTMVLNPLLRKAINHYHPEVLYMHDVWIYSTCLSIGGKVFFDKQSHILYRQHSSNVIGQGNKLTEWKRRINRITTGQHARYNTALELLRGYENQMPQANFQLTKAFIEAKRNFITRLKLLYDNRLNTANIATSRAFRIALLFGTY